MGTEQTWTVTEVLDRYPSLGLPHFQRGHVWTSDSVSLLLESLYYDTPCGSIILWKPKDPQKEGIALPGAKGITHLLIDGQQRVRTIHDALRDVSSESQDEDMPNDGDVDTGRPRIWCLNLMGVPELSPLLNNEDLANRALFIKAVDPRQTNNNRFKRDLLPLNMLLDEDSKDDAIAWDLLSGKADVMVKAQDIRLRNKVRSMLDRTFFVVIKEETDSENTLADMVHLFNRINSGGMLVQAEERSFATLVSLYPGANDWLHDLFCKIHAVDGCADPGHLMRDDVLRRAQERSFGFKLFMRAFVQSASHHFGRSIGSSTLSFGVVDGRDFQESLKEGATAPVRELFARCAQMIVDVTDVLQNDLWCDSFSFMPETTSLVPVFQLLLRYPGLLRSPDAPEGRARRSLVAYLMMKLLLAGLDQKEVLQIAASISSSHYLEQCFKIVKEIETPDLKDRLEESNTLSGRYVLMFYWLVRRRGAQDFLYEQLNPTPASPLQPGQEVLISRDVDPEKQHIVPYSHLARPYGITGRGRISSHAVNNIGNLTYISSTLNHFETGLGADFLDMEREMSVSPDNMEAHFLADRKTLADYSTCRDLLDRREEMGDAKDSTIRKRFEAFCSRRRDAIAKGFLEWLAELERAAAVSEEIRLRTEPEPRLFWRSLSDHIRGLEYDNPIEDELHELCDVGLVTPQWEDGDGSEDRLLKGLRVGLHKPEKKKRVLELAFDANSITLRLRERKHPLSLSVLKLAAQLQERDPTAVLVEPPDRIRLATHTAGSDVTCELLRGLNGLVSGRTPLPDADAIRATLDPALLTMPEKEGVHSPGRKRNLSREELRALADAAGVLNLYDRALNELAPLVYTVTTTRSNLAFQGLLGERRSPVVLFGVYPCASNSLLGLAVMIYPDRTSQYIGITEEQLRDVVGEPPNTADTWSPETTWLMNAETLDAFIQLIKQAEG